MITVIIPTRDRPADLLACLAGLACQDSRSLLSRIVVVDDNSRRPYGDLITRFAAESGAPVISPADFAGRGAADARNHGCRYAVGEIIAFLDDDAIPAANWLRVIATHMKKAEVSAITGRILPLDEQKLFSRARQLRYELRQRNALAQEGPVSFLAGGNSAIRRADFENLGGFNTAFTAMHDQELVLRLRKENKHCFYVHDLLIRHRHYKGLKLALTQSFRSAYYRLQLERSYSHLQRWSPRGQLRGFSAIMNASRSDPNLTMPALVAAFTEMVHSCGYLWYKSSDRFRRNNGKCDREIS